MSQDNFPYGQDNNRAQNNENNLYDSYQPNPQDNDLDLNLRNEQPSQPDFQQSGASQQNFSNPAPTDAYRQPGYQTAVNQPAQSQPGYQQPPAYNQQPSYGNFQPNYAVSPAQQYPPAQQKSKVAAGLLGIFFGSLGIHNFYTGRTNIALIQLIGFLGSFILYIILIGPLIQMAIGLWAFIEGILYLCGSGSYAYDAKGIPLN